jgi:peptidoglycan/LPS O-acetylase OafA/YrhL
MKQLAPLTGLRGVAACSVLVAHAIDSAFQYDRAHFNPHATALAYFGMSLFFVLSGFVIQYNYGQSFRSLPLRVAARRFYVARFARLYPLYAVSILISLSFIPTPWPAWINASYLTLTQSWFNVEMAAFPPDWSISTEWFFYLAFIPLTALVIRVQRPFTTLVALCAVAVIGLGLAFHFWQEPITALAQNWFWHGEQVSDDAWHWCIYFSPYIRVLDFLVGMLAARCYQMSSLTHLRANAVVLTVGLAWCTLAYASGVANLLFLNNLMPNFAFAPGIALVMIATSRGEDALARTLSSPATLFFGEISYSIYIWSIFVVNALASMLQPSMLQVRDQITIAYLNSALKVVIIFALTVMMAYGSYHLIEMPSRRWLRKRFAGS